MKRYTYTCPTEGNSRGRFFRLLLSLTVLSFLLQGCDDFVDVALPPTQLTSEAIFEDRQTATAAMTEIYSKLRASGILAGTASGLSLKLGLYADELDYYGADGNSTADFFGNSVQAADSDIAALWNASYKQIYACNAVIEGVERSTGLQQADKSQLKGEALFVRGLVHLYLVNLYGGVPYITTTDYRANSTAARMLPAEVYEHIFTDLEMAASLLTAEYITGERVRPNAFAAKALLARAYLYGGRWAEASNMASAVLNEAALYSLGSIEGTFLRDANSTIWQLMPASDGLNTDEAGTFVFTEGPPFFVALGDGLMEAFEPGDLRKENWTNAITDGTTTWYHANKYKANTPTGSSVEFPIVLRLAEQYLIRSEARARQGELTGAKEDLDIIRNRAGLGNSTAVTQAALLDAVLQERRVELFTEYGHRFFDLRNGGQLDAALGTKSGWQTTDRLLPLPETELLTNPNLGTQNPGY
ncbi:RagB/SusD family nutrient uptake outer membrane protein [Flavobacterium sp. PLA-1-15]|uniref:RagB/SusD family nutrient uptake outer membrane protein n=1 Tax=Flavobacterium sp. PLA-1-15 TaxID=3380533 RepID=UPI003B79648B